MNDINFIGKTNFRNEEKRFGIRLDDRRKHVYVIGKTGMGKTQLLKNMAIQDIQAGRGIGFVDPHGEAAEEIIEFVPKERIKDVIYFNPSDRDFPISFNVMEDVPPEQRHLVASGLMGVFKKIWPDVWSARMEYILNNSILALLEHPTTTLLGINRILVDVDYRNQVVEKLTDPVVKAFWEQEYARYTQRYEVEATAAIQNKIGQFISSPLIRNIIGQQKSSIDMRAIMDNKKIFIMNLSKGRIGEDSSKLLGGLLITKLQLAAMSRVDTPEEERADFFLYVDEFQNFATESFANILSEARKYRLDLTLGHQYIAQMEETVGDAVFGNVGTLICFRVGAEDAEFLEKEFSPEIMAVDLVNLPKFQIYLKLMINGVASSAFSAKTLEPFPDLPGSPKTEIVNYTREHYTIARSDIEEKIAQWTGSFAASNANAKAPANANGPAVEMHEIVCQKCHKPSKVPFKPEPGRPVYCKPCRKLLDVEFQAKKEKNQPEPKIQKQPEAPKQAVPNPPTSQQAPPQEAQPDNFSLEELLSKKTVPFARRKARSEELQEKDKEGLKKALQTALQEQEKKKLFPGQVARFEP